MPRPFRKELGWSPYFYLIYVFFVLMQPVLDHAKTLEWVVTGVGFVLFIPCYLGVFQRWRPGAIWYAGGLAVLGFASMPFNLGTACYVIYAGASLGFVVRPPLTRCAFWLLMSLLTLEFWLLHVPPWYAVFMLLVTATISLANIRHGTENRANAKLKLAHASASGQGGGTGANCSRLHDVLGHTLSVIVLKSELAGRLFERDPSSAPMEIKQVEEIARHSLSDVRQAIGGYRAASLPEEFARAKDTLETAGVVAECDVSERSATLGATQEAILSLIVREAVTNVVRHASASHCQLSLGYSAKGWRLAIVDDGRGGGLEEGNGLRGMRERAEALGGSMRCDGKRGTALEIFIPHRVVEEASA